MRFVEMGVAGAYIIEPERREDDRGFFARVWCERELEERGLNPRVAQVNLQFTHRAGSIRGLHFQIAPRQEAKIVRCTAGALFDVMVDLRPGSPTRGRWAGVELAAETRRMTYVPEGCAHGYQTLTDNTEAYYHTSDFYAPELCRGVRYDDPAFGIRWPLPVTNISDPDRAWPDYRDAVPAGVGLENGAE
jgi:dTDP-4-dehydrorhamnose 3,5-epimerase